MCLSLASSIYQHHYTAYIIDNFVIVACDCFRYTYSVTFLINNFAGRKGQSRVGFYTCSQIIPLCKSGLLAKFRNWQVNKMIKSNKINVNSTTKVACVVFIFYFYFILMLNSTFNHTFTFNYSTLNYTWKSTAIHVRA